MYGYGFVCRVIRLVKKCWKGFLVYYGRLDIYICLLFFLGEFSLLFLFLVKYKCVNDFFLEIVSIKLVE